MVKLEVYKDVLAENSKISADNRELFDQHGLLVINLMSSPGAGKTTLLEKTIQVLKDQYSLGVIEGDIQDRYDAERLAGYGIPVEQINTGGACHIDSNMIRQFLPRFDLGCLDLLIIENVGNLVCPAEFQLGEHEKIMMLSTPEGDDKPAKYPLMFKESTVLLINKIDLLPYVQFDMARAKADALGLNPKLKVFEVSCITGQGVKDWITWLSSKIQEYQNSRKR